MERVAAGLSILVLFPAALLITALEGGRPALRELFARMLRWRVGIVWWVFALLALPTTTVLLAVAFGDSLHLPGPRVLAGERQIDPAGGASGWARLAPAESLRR
jgi:hypothetical protein